MITDEMVAAARRRAPKAWRETSQCDKHIRAMLRAAEAAAWQPIETAPKDEYVMTAINGSGFKPEIDQSSEFEPFGPTFVGNEWLYPTHWRPFPACPDEG